MSEGVFYESDFDDSFSVDEYHEPYIKLLKERIKQLEIKMDRKRLRVFCLESQVNRYKSKVNRYKWKVNKLLKKVKELKKTG